MEDDLKNKLYSKTTYFEGGSNMSLIKKLVALATLSAMLGMSGHPLEAVSYVTDTGGYAYDESRAATNLAPAIALGTVAVVGVIALAVQNSHHHSSSSSHYGYYSSTSSNSSSSSYSSSPYYYYYYYASTSGHF